MLFGKVVEFFEKMSMTSKRLELSDIYRDLILESNDEYALVLYLSKGMVAPDYEGIEIGLAEKTIIKVIRKITGVTEEEIMKRYAKEGDLGTVSQELSSQSKQRSFFDDPLTLRELYDSLRKVATIKGQGTASEKEKIFIDLMIRASPIESKYIVRILQGRLRLGVSDSTILYALRIAYMENVDQDKVEELYNFHPDLAYVAKILKEGNSSMIENASPQPLIPVKVMLAERLQSIDEILQKMGGKAAFENKYDGLRIQVHKQGDVVKTFSRGIEETTNQFPEVVNYFRSLPYESFIVDGEAVPFNVETEEIYPFQNVSRRRGRKYDLGKYEEDIPIVVFLFDIIYFERKPLNRLSYLSRTNLLREKFTEGDRIRFAKRIISSDESEIEKFFENSISSGCEGVVAKDIRDDTVYRAGARGWLWIKFKRDYRNELADSLDLVVIGAFFGHGKRKGSYGALLLASYNKEEDTFESVCKLGTGFTDEMLAQLKSLFSELVTEKKPARVNSQMVPDVWIYPEKVMEVVGAEITKSPIHTCSNSVLNGQGLALRFPRFTGRYRTDKKPEDATSSEEIYEMFKNQNKNIYKDEQN
ncbi:ATP-dependent DNA ligase [Cuniculiplasma sp. SKW3]|uniref:ATP-dependent DNA ligase n=1 Tax=unclassified Cuniculiplasma TaxID=2619706 RepID=UPI003FD03387